MVIPPSHEYKQSVVAQAQKDFGYKTLIETGTFRCDMIQGQLTNFDLIISIEIDRRMYDDAVNRFAGNNNVRLVHGNSALVMDGILSGIKDPCIFWLDGHYFRPEQTPAGQKQSPVLEELESILRHPVRHVILIDDIRLFNGVHYPTIEQVKEKMIGYNCHIENDIMKLW